MARPLWWRNRKRTQPLAQRMWIDTPTVGVFFFYNSFNMSNEKNEAGILLPITVTENLTVNVIPDVEHEYLMTTREVANGYGTSIYAINMARMRHDDELIEGKHFITAITKCYSDIGLPHNAILWTKRGIVRLGFFIKSDRAKLFRDWAEELVIKIDELRLSDVKQVRQVGEHKRNHNRLTQERLVSIMSDVCMITDDELRVRIARKLMGKEANYGC